MSVYPRLAGRIARQEFHTSQIVKSVPSLAARVSIISRRQIHSSPFAGALPMNPEPQDNPLQNQPRGHEDIGKKRFADFDLGGKVCLVTGGAQGLGLAMAEALVEAGCNVYCLDRSEKPGEYFHEAEARVVPEWGGALHYRRVDITDTEMLNDTIGQIGEDNKRIDGLVCAAAIQQVTPAVEYSARDACKMMDINYTGVFMSCTAVAREMFKYKCRGSICIVASMSGLVANKGLLSPVYNSSKAACLQLARNLAMEWTPVRADGTGGIRVNCLSPGHIMTPMVAKNLKDEPELEKMWTRENMMGRLATTSEFKSAGLFLLSGASSFMTANNLVIDGGHTGW